MSMTSRARYQSVRERAFVVGGVALLVVIVDQISKFLAVELLAGRGIISLFGDTLRLLLAENHGGFLSMGASLSPEMRSLIFLVLTSLFLLGFTVFTLIDKSADRCMLISSAFIIGGGIGNLIDRALRDGAVIDFLNMGVGSLRTGIFNVADMAVLFGCIALFYGLVRSGKTRKAPKTDTPG